MKKIFITAIFSIILNSPPSFGQIAPAIVEDRTKKIEVTGSAEMKIIPDEIYVSFTQQEYYNKQKMKIDIDQVQKDFLERCNKANISKDRIQLQNMSGFDSNAWYWNKRKKVE